MNRLLLGAALGAAVALGAVSNAAHAALFTGSLWENVTTDATNATVPGTPANFTFNASGVDFSSYGNASCLTGTCTGNPSADYTVGGFLNSLGQASNITNTGHGGALTDTMNNVFVQILGTATFTHGQAFTFAQDDALIFSVNGTDVIDNPGPHSPVLSNGVYNGPTGTFSFEVDYGEIDGPPAVLQTNLVPNTVPEPASLALFGGALLGLGLLRRRRRNVA